MRWVSVRRIFGYHQKGQPSVNNSTSVTKYDNWCPFLLRFSNLLLINLFDVKMRQRHAFVWDIGWFMFTEFHFLSPIIIGLLRTWKHFVSLVGGRLFLHYYLFLSVRTFSVKTSVQSTAHDAQRTSNAIGFLTMDCTRRTQLTLILI